MRRTLLFAGALCLLARLPLQAQVPHINTFFPLGGQAGKTVEVEVRGASLDGADQLLLQSSGLSGTVQATGGKPDETNKPIFQAKCGTCHELRSFANRSLTPAQWAATVERMVSVRQAPIAPAEQQKIIQFLQGGARSGRVTAQIKIGPETLPGLYEIRVVSARGVSTASYFEVGNLPELFAVSNKKTEPLAVTLPCVVNGGFAGNAERHFLKFAAKKGQRLVFNLKAFRFHEQTQLFFNPVLTLYNASGAEVAENHGYYDLDPLIDYLAPADGDYLLEVRDLLGRGNPSSVYRMAMGAVSYDTVLYPPAVQMGSRPNLTVIGKNEDGRQGSYTPPAPSQPGLALLGSPMGPQHAYVSPFPVVRALSSAVSNSAPSSSLPAAFTGRISQVGESNLFKLLGDGNTYEFEGFVARVDSPASLRVSLLNAEGRAVAAFSNDARMTAKLEKGKAYGLKVEEIAGKAGPEFVYVVEARPQRPNIELVARPANITLRPGLATAVEVTLVRREGVEGDVTLSVNGLPAGVTAQPAVISPDRNTGWVILQSEPSVNQGAHVIEIVASAKGPSGQVRARAMPQEMEYRLNNNPRYFNRESMVLAVRGEPPFYPRVVTQAPLRVHPRQAIELKVAIKRQGGYKGPAIVSVGGLPTGWVAPQQTLPAEKEEVTLQVRPDGNNPQGFLNRDPKLSPIRAVVHVTAEEFEFVAGTIQVVRAEKIEEEEKR